MKENKNKGARTQKQPWLPTLGLVLRSYLGRSLGIGTIAGLTVLAGFQFSTALYTAQSRLALQAAEIPNAQLGQLPLQSLIATHNAKIESSQFLGAFWEQLSDLAKAKTLKPFGKNGHTPAEAVAILQNAISAQRIEGSTLIGISVSHPYPYVSKYLADELAKFYPVFAQAQYTQSRQGTHNDLYDAAERAKAAKQAAQIELDRFAKTVPSTQPKWEGNIVSMRLQEANAAYLAAKSDRIGLQKSVEQIKKNRSKGLDALLTLTPINSDPQVRALNREAATLLKTLEQTPAKLNARQALEREDLVVQIASNRRRIEIEADSLANGLSYQYEVAEAIEAELLQELRALEKQSSQNAAIAARLQSLEDSVLSLQQKEEQAYAQLAAAISEDGKKRTSIRFLDTATIPRSPSFPESKVVLIYAGACFLAAFALTALFLFLTSKRFEAWDDIESELNATILGTIPQVKAAPGAARYSSNLGRRKRDQPTLDFDKVKDSHSRESLSALASRLLLGTLSRGSKVLLVTSHGENEGKSTSVFNLAKSFSRAGKRTLVIDCDLRHDLLSKTFEKSGTLKTAKGLNLYQWFQAEQNAANSAELAICKSHKLNNLDFIPGGHAGEETAKLILSQEFQNLISRLRSLYDIILFDSPPAGVFSDALLLTTVCDEVLFLIRDQAAEKANAKRTLQTLKAGHAHIAGVALNGLSKKRVRMIGSYYDRTNRPHAIESKSVA